MYIINVTRLIVNCEHMMLRRDENIKDPGFWVDRNLTLKCNQ